MLKSNVLQPLVGTKGTKIFPYIRKIDLMSSNSFILSSEEQISLVDPGANVDQICHLIGEITSMFEEKPRPVVIYLTHSHLDHCFQLRYCQEIRNIGRILIAAQEKGAEAIENCDSKLTLSDLLGKKLAGISIDIRLLSNRDILVGGEKRLHIGGVEYAYLTRSIKIPRGPILDSQIVTLGKGDQLEIYLTPGHSPDSICIRAGRVLFVGDLFFAPNPGVAGAYGWSQSDLLETIQKITWILEQKNLLLCCSGHGKVIDADTAWSTLREMYQDVLSLSGLEEITPKWARSTAAYAEDLMKELERLFTIITGRLAYISHVLEKLEEMDEAENWQSLIDAEQIDELFSQFNGFVMELQAGKKLDWDLVHKAGQTVGKLDRVFENRELRSVLNQSLLNRASRMLNDYAIIYRGFKPTYYVSNIDINTLIKEVLEYARYRHEKDAILDAETYEDYLWALKRRIAHINVFEKTALDFEEAQGLPLTRMDKERFVEAIIDILERLSSAGAKRIIITPLYNQGWITIRISVTDSVSIHLWKDVTLRYFERALALCGGFIQTYASQEGLVVEIEFLSCEMF
jgi:glyoxylase-like metal-dependent hydrolase (beta-lactamase superfamily II)